jgi:hypothetical protein
MASKLTANMRKLIACHIDRLMIDDRYFCFSAGVLGVGVFTLLALAVSVVRAICGA